MGCLPPESRRVRGNIGGLLPRVLPSASVGMAKTQRCTVRDRAGKSLRLLRKKRGEPCWRTPRTVRQNRPGLARALVGSVPPRSRPAVRGLKPRLGVCAPLKGAPPEPSAPSQGADDSEERTVRLTWNAVAVVAPHIPPRLRAVPSTLSWRDSRRRVPSRLPLTVETYARHRDPRRADRRIARGFAAPAPAPAPVAAAGHRAAGRRRAAVGDRASPGRPPRSHARARYDGRIAALPCPRSRQRLAAQRARRGRGRNRPRPAPGRAAPFQPERPAAPQAASPHRPAPPGREQGNAADRGPAAALRAAARTRAAAPRRRD